MKILKTSDEKVRAIIEKSTIDKTKKFKLSDYVYLFSENGVYIIKNTLSGEVISLEKAEFEAISALKENPAGYDFISENSLEELVKKRFIVEEDYNEPEKYMSAIEMLTLMKGRKKGLGSYVIFPTTGCNARCVYCFELDFVPKTMSLKTADRLIDYICETKHDGKIKLK